MLDPLTARIAKAQEQARKRADQLRLAVPDVVATLVRHGASRVRMFGSLATGKQPHAGTDLDLCIWGLDDSALLRATCEFLERGLPVQLIRGETAAPRLRERIEQEGIEVSLGS